MNITVIIIYLIGVFIAYLSMRAVTKKMFNEWTQADRAFIMLISLASWVMVLIASGYFFINSFDGKKEAKW